MQLKKEFSVLFMTILTLSMMSSPSLTNAQDVMDLHTGDEFGFYSDVSQGYHDSVHSTLYNVSNGNDLVVRSEYRDEYIYGEGETDVTTVVNPEPPFWPNADVGLIIDQELQVTDGEYYEERYVNDTLESGNNVNETYSEPRDGYFMHFRDTVYAASNSTYRVIPPELVASDMWAPFPPLPPNLEEVIDLPDDPRANLLSRNVSTGNATYNVNGESMFFDTYNVSSEFIYKFQQNFVTMIPFGPEDDSNTEWIEVNGTFYYEFYIYTVHIFDVNTGILLERNSLDNVFVWVELYNDLFTLENIPGWDLGFWMHISFGHWFEQHMEINFASSYFGNSRPTSSGENRLEAGENLVYQTNGDKDIHADLSFSSPDQDFSGSYDSQIDIDGKGMINVYYHEPGFFKAVLKHSGTVNGKNSETENGQTFSETIQEEFYQLDVFETPSNDSFEIAPFYEPEMFIDYPWYHDHRDDETPSFLFELPDRIPMVGINEYLEYPNYTINGFEYLIEAKIIEVDYHLEETFQTYNPELDMELTLDIKADGRTRLVYDAWTGVLIEQSERINVDVRGAPSSTLSLDQLENTFDFQMTISDSLKFELSNHPNQYQGEQTEFPEVPNDGTNDTFTTGSESEDDTEPSLDLPFPFLPTFVSLVFIAIFIKRHR